MTADEIFTNNGFIVLCETNGWRYYGYDNPDGGWIGRTYIGTHTAEFFKRCYIEKNRISVDNLTQFWLVTPLDLYSFEHDVIVFVKEWKKYKEQLNIKNIQKDFE